MSNADTGLQHVFAPNAPSPAGPYTPIVVVDGLIFVSGQTGKTPGGETTADNIEVQAHQTFENMRNCLETVGATLADVIKITAYLRDWSDFARFNNVYREYFSEPYPARTTVPTPFPIIRVEVDCIARASR